MANKQIIIEATTLYDGKLKRNNVYIIIEKNKIIDVSNSRLKPDYSGFVTPAFIDGHSHIGMMRQGEPENEHEVNDRIDQITPLNNPLNSVYFDDRAFTEACDFGVLYSCLVPGSGNVFGGKAIIIKNFALNRGEAVVKEYGYKMALGFNPRSTASWKGTRPNTRMGVYALLEDKFNSTLNKEKKAKLELEKKINDLNSRLKEKKITEKEKKIEEDLINKGFEFEFSQEDKAILEVLRGEKTVKVHVHKEDDALYLIELVKKFNLKVTAEHTCDIFHKEIFDKLAANDINVIYGPLGSLDYKVELKHAYYQNIALLMKSTAFYGLMTDHPVILTPNLRESLKYFLIQGMTEEEAISLITFKNAKILGVDDILGTVETNKLASIIVWDKNPLHLGAFPKVVIAEGRVIRKK